METRAKHYNINMFHEIGVKSDQGEFKCRYGSHLDAFYWVKRDSYLPQGSQGLKVILFKNLILLELFFFFLKRLLLKQN